MNRFLSSSRWVLALLLLAPLALQAQTRGRSTARSYASDTMGFDRSGLNAQSLRYGTPEYDAFDRDTRTNQAGSQSDSRVRVGYPSARGNYNRDVSPAPGAQNESNTSQLLGNRPPNPGRAGSNTLPDNTRREAIPPDAPRELPKAGEGMDAPADTATPPGSGTQMMRRPNGNPSSTNPAPTTGGGR